MDPAKLVRSNNNVLAFMARRPLANSIMLGKLCVEVATAVLPTATVKNSGDRAA
jgi:hypothetical protein